jgi:hypothetical protein
MPEVIYSLDTSALIDGLERYYSPEVFSGLWEAVDDLIESGRCIASEEVWEEVKRKDEAAMSWAQPRRAKLFIPTDSAITAEVRSILQTYPRMVMSGGRRNRADPFVVATAKLRNATVVTGEGDNGNMTRPKIPFVCAEMGIPCIRFTDLISSENWTFGLISSS